MSQRSYGLSILIAGSDPDDRLLLELELKNHPFLGALVFIPQLSQVGDYLQHRGAWTSLPEAPPPSLILIDSYPSFPELEEALKTIEGCATEPGIPVSVVVDSLAEAEYLFERSHLYLRGYLVRPVTVDALERLVDLL